MPLVNYTNYTYAPFPLMYHLIICIFSSIILIIRFSQKKKLYLLAMLIGIDLTFITQFTQNKHLIFIIGMLEIVFVSFVLVSIFFNNTITKIYNKKNAVSEDINDDEPEINDKYYDFNSGEKLINNGKSPNYHEMSNDINYYLQQNQMQKQKDLQNININMPSDNNEYRNDFQNDSELKQKSYYNKPDNINPVPQNNMEQEVKSNFDIDNELSSFPVISDVTLNAYSDNYVATQNMGNIQNRSNNFKLNIQDMNDKLTPPDITKNRSYNSANQIDNNIFYKNLQKNDKYYNNSNDKDMPRINNPGVQPADKATGYNPTYKMNQNNQNSEGLNNNSLVNNKTLFNNKPLVQNTMKSRAIQENLEQKNNPLLNNKNPVKKTSKDNPDVLNLYTDDYFDNL